MAIFFKFTDYRQYRQVDKDNDMNDTEQMRFYL